MAFFRFLFFNPFQNKQPSLIQWNMASRAKPTSFVAVSFSVANLAKDQLGMNFSLAQPGEREKIKSEFGVSGGDILPPHPPSGEF